MYKECEVVMLPTEDEKAELLVSEPKPTLSKGKNSKSFYEHESTKKIIASTNKSLKILSTNSTNLGRSSLLVNKPLPQIPESFIKEYCVKGGIDTVLVEYYEVTEPVGTTINGRRPTGIMKLKVSKDNTITIKLVKQTYSTQEVENLILRFANDAGNDEDLLHHYGGIFKAAKNWIKENL